MLYFHSPKQTNRDGNADRGNGLNLQMEVWLRDYDNGFCENCFCVQDEKICGDLY